MRTSFFLIAVMSVVAWGCSGNSTKESANCQAVRLIFDSDFGPDYDDVGALALIHALADNGEVEILATVSSNRNELVAPCLEVFNRYFNRPDIPIGATKSEEAPDHTTWHKVKWTEEIPKRYEHTIAKTSDVPDAVKVYRKILSEQPDKSVIICTVGYLTNMKSLLCSTPDEYSDLSGKELIEKKVKHLVSMAGSFPEGREYNVFADLPASMAVVAQWPTEIYFSGFEIGWNVRTGKGLVNMDVEDSPVKLVYEMCFAEDDPDGHMSWDQTAALVAVKGYEPYYSIERGIVEVREDSMSIWQPDEAGNHLRLIEKMPFEEVAGIIDNYMMHQPQKTEFP